MTTREHHLESQPRQTVILPCERREPYNEPTGHGQLRVVPSAAHCNEWTLHTLVKCDHDGALHYQCAVCGARRVFGTWNGDPRQLNIGGGEAEA